MLFHLVLADTEFPNDNPWLGDPCGVLAFTNDTEWGDETASIEPPVEEPMTKPVAPPVAERIVVTSVPVLVEPPAVVVAEVPVADAVELSEEAIGAVVAPRESGIHVRGEPFDPPVGLEAEDPDGIEVVDEFEDFEVGLSNEEQARTADPFAVFVRTLVEVAEDAGCPRAAALLPALLGGEAVAIDGLPEATVQALLADGVLAQTPTGHSATDSLRATAGAWRAILSGDSEDFSACGSRMLDEWAADLVARILLSPSKTEHLRRELRARGVAAFGLVLAA